MELWWRGRAVVVLQSQAGATPLVAVPLLWLVAATLPIVGEELPWWAVAVVAQQLS